MDLKFTSSKKIHYKKKNFHKNEPHGAGIKKKKLPNFSHKNGWENFESIY